MKYAILIIMLLSVVGCGNWLKTKKTQPAPEYVESLPQEPESEPADDKSESMDAEQKLDMAEEYAECIQDGIDIYARGNYPSEEMKKKYFRMLLLPCRHISPEYFDEDNFISPKE